MPASTLKEKKASFASSCLHRLFSTLKFHMCIGLLLGGKSHIKALATFVFTFMSKQLLVAQSWGFHTPTSFTLKLNVSFACFERHSPNSSAHSTTTKQLLVMVSCYHTQRQKL